MSRRVVKVDLTPRNAQGVPMPAPEHRATITPRTLELGCSCGEVFRKSGLTDKPAAIAHLRKMRRKQLDLWRHGATRAERREKRARDGRRRLAEIPDGGAWTSTLAKAWHVSARAASRWLAARALEGKVTSDLVRGVTVWWRA